MKRVEITAHRGSSAKAPENTLSALRLAMVDGADYAEVDVQRTRDGVPVLLHDGDLRRVAGDPRRLEAMSWAELRQVEVGGWFAPAFRGERVPALLEVLRLVRGRMRLNLELKFNRSDAGLVPGVLALLRQEKALEDCLLTSMNSAAMAEVRRLEPRLRIGLILTSPVTDLTTLPVEVVSVPLDGATPALVEAARQAGKQVHVWTVNRERDMRQLIKWGVDNIITDRPEVLRSLLMRPTVR